MAVGAITSLYLGLVAKRGWRWFGTLAVVTAYVIEGVTSAPGVAVNIPRSGVYLARSSRTVLTRDNISVSSFGSLLQNSWGGFKGLDVRFYVYIYQAVATAWDCRKHVVSGVHFS